jgi:hypothetical protein
MAVRPDGILLSLAYLSSGIASIMHCPFGLWRFCWHLAQKCIAHQAPFPWTEGLGDPTAAAAWLTAAELPQM